MWGDRRKTVGSRPTTNMRTPTRARLTDVVASSSVKKNPIGSGRMSVDGSNSRRPSIFQRTTTVAPRDVKGMFNQNVAKIYGFLLETEGEDSLAESRIRTPKGKQDFMDMFEMIYHHLSDDFQFEPQCRLEEFVPPIFKSLGYPTVLKSSAFLPMGSQHGWPILIDAMAWLVDVVRMSLAVSKQAPQILLGEAAKQQMATEKAVSYSWYNAAYKEYTHNRGLLNDQNYIAQKQRQLRMWYEQQDNLDEQMNSAESQLEMVRFECAELEDDKGNELQCREDLQRVEGDIRRAVDYKNDVAVNLQRTEDDLKAVEGKLEEMRGEARQLNEEIEEKKKQIEVQAKQHGLSGDGARKLTTEIAQDKETLREIQKSLEQMTKEIWLLAPKNRETFKEQQHRFESLLNAMNGITRDLMINNLTPIKIPTSENELSQALESIQSHWIPRVASAIDVQKLKIEEETARMQQLTETASNNVAIEQEKQENLKKREGREERVRRREKEEWKAERSRLEQNIESLENEKEIGAEKMTEVCQIENKVAEESAEYENLVSDVAGQMQKLNTMVRAKVEPLVEKMFSMENERLWMQNSMLDLTDSWKNEKEN